MRCIMPLLIQAIIVSATPIVYSNITILVPEGTTTHGDSNLLCEPSKWTDIIAFFIGNYFAHAITTRSFPGEYNLNSISAVICALLLPGAGTLRGLIGIFTMAIFGKTNMHVGARAGAFRMLVRTANWKPAPGDLITNGIISPGNAKNEISGKLTL
jgi:hypothetical protein